MPNPMAWALPLFRAFGVQVRVHLLFFLVTLGLVLREVLRKEAYVSFGDVALFTVVMLFGIILVHEFGHVFGGRSVGGDCEDILIWPLGGLAFVQVPHDWKSHTWTAFSGPLTNIAMALLAGAILATQGFLPSLSPLDNPYLAPMKNFRDGRVYTSEYAVKLYVPETSQPLYNGKYDVIGKPDAMNEWVSKQGNYERALAPLWAVWIDRFYWLNVFLLLLNLIPAYPLDGGQILQGFIWRSTDYRQGTLFACGSGYVVAMIMFVVALVVEEVALVMLLSFIFITSYLKMKELLEGGGEFGYGGYGSEDDEENSKPKKTLGPFKRWMQARALKRMKREQEEQKQDDERMDQLLEKIAQQGQASLTADEKRFMQRMSERYRK